MSFAQNLNFTMLPTWTEYAGRKELKTGRNPQNDSFSEGKMATENLPRHPCHP